MDRSEVIGVGRMRNDLPATWRVFIGFAPLSYISCHFRTSGLFLLMLFVKQLAN